MHSADLLARNILASFLCPYNADWHLSHHTLGTVLSEHEMCTPCPLSIFFHTHAAVGLTPEACGHSGAVRCRAQANASDLGPLPWRASSAAHTITLPLGYWETRYGDLPDHLWAGSAALSQPQGEQSLPEPPGGRRQQPGQGNN